MERRRGRSDGSLLVGLEGGWFGLGGGESEKMSERGLVGSVGDGGVEGGVDDILGEASMLVVGGLGVEGLLRVEERTPAGARQSDRRQGL